MPTYYDADRSDNLSNISDFDLHDLQSSLELYYSQRSATAPTVTIQTWYQERTDTETATENSTSDVVSSHGESNNQAADAGENFQHFAPMADYRQAGVIFALDQQRDDFKNPFTEPGQGQVDSPSPDVSPNTRLPDLDSGGGVLSLFQDVESDDKEDSTPTSSSPDSITLAPPVLQLVAPHSSTIYPSQPVITSQGAVFCHGEEVSYFSSPSSFSPSSSCSSDFYFPTSPRTAFLAGIDVKALIADRNNATYTIVNTDDHPVNAGRTSHYHFTPHAPREKCNCHWCDLHRERVRTDWYLDPEPHDRSEWCHCGACWTFRIGNLQRQQGDEEEEEGVEWRRKSSSLCRAPLFEWIQKKLRN